LTLRHYARLAPLALIARQFSATLKHYASQRQLMPAIAASAIAMPLPLLPLSLLPLLALLYACHY
jgi:hypothetical protein